MDTLASDPAVFGSLPAHAQAALYVAVAALEARLRASLLCQREAPVVTPASEKDQLLTPEQAAERLGVTVAWLYRHSATLPFARHLGRKTLRFSARGLERWQATRKPSSIVNDTQES